MPEYRHLPLMSNVSQRQMLLLQRPARFAQPVRLRALRRPVVVRHGSKFVAGCPRFAGQRASGADRPNQCPRLAAPRPCLSKKLSAALREASGRRPHLAVVAGWAVSSLKRDTCDEVGRESGEDLVRGFEAEDFAWSVIECVFDGGELLVADETQVHAFRKELADQAIGVFVGAALPGTVRVAEEDVHVELGAQRLVQRHLRALVIRHRLSQARRDAFEAALEAFEDIGSAATVELDEHHIAAGAFDQRAHRRAVHRAFDEVTLPMPGHDAGGHLGWAQVDGSHVGQAAGLADAAACAWQARLVALAQQLDQLAAQRATWHGVDGAVDGLVRHERALVRKGLASERSGRSGRFHARQLACNLLGRPAAAQAAQDGAPKRRVDVCAELAPARAGGRAPSAGTRLRAPGAIARSRHRRTGLGAIDFTRYGRMVELESPGDFSATQLGLKQGLNRQAISLRDLRVVRLHLADTLQGGGRRTSKLSRPFPFRVS